MLRDGYGSYPGAQQEMGQCKMLLMKDTRPVELSLIYYTVFLLFSALIKVKLLKLNLIKLNFADAKTSQKNKGEYEAFGNIS